MKINNGQKVLVVILAGGKSRRMMGKDKSLAIINKEKLLDICFKIERAKLITDNGFSGINPTGMYMDEQNVGKEPIRTKFNYISSIDGYREVSEADAQTATSD